MAEGDENIVSEEVPLGEDDATTTAPVSFDFSNNIFSGEQKIVFHHKWSSTSVEFKAFDLSYSESITNDWEEVVLPRRINRSYTWSGVIRSIQLGWSMPAFDIAEAKLNLAKCSRLVRMMYPMTDTTSQITGANPVWHLGIMNWVHSSKSAWASSESPETLLAGFPSSFTWDIIPEEGFLYEGPAAYPKSLKASMGYTVLLDDSLNFGWSDEGQWSSGPVSFPWSSDEGSYK